MVRSRLANQRGDTLIEVILALAILSMVLFASFNLVNTGFQVSQVSKERSQVDALMQEQAEALRSFRDQSTWSAFVGSFSSGHYYMSLSGGKWVPVSGDYTPQ